MSRLKSIAAAAAIGTAVITANANDAVASGITPTAYFLPYQAEIIRDDARIIVVEKSRQIGASFALAYRVVKERVSGERPYNFWYSSADESAAREFIGYVKMWSERFGKALQIVYGEELFGDDKIKVMSVAVPGPDGREHRVVAMTSSPKTFRSKSGDVGLDEFAHHGDALGMWKAAKPVTTWGYRVYILSTHNGVESLFNTLFVEPGKRRLNPELHGAPKPFDIPVSLHTITIHDAVEQGLVEKINQHAGTTMTREAFLEQTRADCGTQEVWEEEYECKPSAQSGSYFPYELIRPCVRDDAPAPTENLSQFISDCVARCGEGSEGIYLGVDVGRKRDRFVVWGAARFGGSMRAVGILSWQHRKWNMMETALDTMMRSGSLGSRVVRMVIDETGIGHMLAERMIDKYRHRVEGVTFTNAIKAHLAALSRRHIEERTSTLPDDPEVLASFNSIKREVTAAGNIRFDGERNEHGHADEFWAFALSMHAAETKAPIFRQVPVMGGVM